MNQLRDWEGHCQKCLKKTEDYVMSVFDVSLICKNCSDLEMKYREILLKEKKDKSIRSHQN